MRRGNARARVGGDEIEVWCGPHSVIYDDDDEDYDFYDEEY